MPVDPASILAILQVVRFGVETVELWQKGDITQEELDARWEKMRGELKDANELWESTLRPPQ